MENKNFVKELASTDFNSSKSSFNPNKSKKYDVVANPVLYEFGWYETVHEPDCIIAPSNKFCANGLTINVHTDNPPVYTPVYLCGK